MIFSSAPAEEPALDGPQYNLSSYSSNDFHVQLVVVVVPAVSAYQDTQAVQMAHVWNVAIQACAVDMYRLCMFKLAIFNIVYAGLQR